MTKLLALLAAMATTGAKPSPPEWIVKLSSETGHGKDDGLKLEQALDGLGIVKLVSADEKRVVLTVRAPSLDRARVVALLVPHPFGLHFLAKDQAPIRPGRAGMKGPNGARAEDDAFLGLLWLASTCESLDPVRAKAAIPPDQWIGCVCDVYRPRAYRCRLMLLEQAPIVAGTSLQYATPGLTDEGVAELSMGFDDEGRRLLAERTRSGIGRFAAMVLDGKALIAPCVKEPIENGRMRVSVGTEGKDTLAQVLETRMLAATISASTLKGRWTVEDVVRVPGKDEL